MSGRNRQPPPSHSLKSHDPSPHFGRGPPQSHPRTSILEDIREFGAPPSMPLRGGPVPRPHHPAIFEEQMAVQHEDLQTLLVDNQRLAATHVALKQELAAAQHEIQRTSHALGSVQAEKDHHLRDVYERSRKLDVELRAVETIRAELMQVRGDVQKLGATRQDLSGQIEAMMQELSRAATDSQKAPAIRGEIDGLKHEIQRARAAIEYEKKGYAESYEQGQVIEKNLVSMAREVEKLRAEIGNTEKRARSAAVPGAGNPDAGYGGNYGNNDGNFGGNPYPNYGSNQVSGGPEAASQYHTGPAHGSWGYDARTHGHR